MCSVGYYLRPLFLVQVPKTFSLEFVPVIRVPAQRHTRLNERPLMKFLFLPAASLAQSADYCNVFGVGLERIANPSS